MLCLFGRHSQWDFSEVNTKVDVHRQKDGTYYFEFKWGLHEKIQVFLESYDKKGKKISGTFKIVDEQASAEVKKANASGAIFFDLFDKKKFVGSPDPQTIHNATWTLWNGKKECPIFRGKR